MKIPNESNKQFKINDKQIVIRSNNDVNLENLHIADGLDNLMFIFDRNGNQIVSAKSYSSIFMNALNEMIGNDNEITDEEIQKFIDKNGIISKVEQVKYTLVNLLGIKENSPFLNQTESKKEKDNNNFRIIKIGNSKIYVGDKLLQDIDLSKYCTKGYCDDQFLHLFINDETKKIDSQKEIDKLYETIESLTNENNEITDEAIEAYISRTPDLEGYDIAYIKEFFIQAFPPPKTHEEKLEYFEKNKKRLDKITSTVNLLNKESNEKLVQIGQNIVAAFQKEYGELESPSMQMIIQKEYYTPNHELNEVMALIRTSKDEDLAKLVKEHGVANCQEDAILTLQMIKEMYPELKPMEIDFSAQNGLDDTGHVAVLIVPKEKESQLLTSANVFLINDNSNIKEFENCYVVDNWFKGVFEANDWINMQKQIHNIQDVEVNTSYYHNL